DKWNWPTDWVNRHPLLRSIRTPSLQDKEDWVQWINYDNQKVNYNTSQAWKTLREDWPKVKWNHVVWKEMLKKSSNLQGKTSLVEIVDIISNGRNKNSIGMVVNKLMLVATVYFLWQERNQRIFRNESRTEEIVCKIIIEQVRNKRLSLKIKKSSNVIKEAKKWNMQWKDMSLIAI
ncbi:hypothetical protein Tco_0982262, partial [Tanacetum coccineum]